MARKQRGNLVAKTVVRSLLSLPDPNTTALRHIINYEKSPIINYSMDVLTDYPATERGRT